MIQPFPSYKVGPASHTGEAPTNPAELQRAAEAAANALTALVDGLGQVGLDVHDLQQLKDAAKIAQGLQHVLPPVVGEEQRARIRAALSLHEAAKSYGSGRMSP